MNWCTKVQRQGHNRRNQRAMKAHHLLHVGEGRDLCGVLAQWLLSLGFDDSSPLGPATTNGAADARTSRDLTRCMMAEIDAQADED